MSKNQFRFLIISSLLIAVLGGVYDLLWPDPTLEKITEYTYELEGGMLEDDIEGIKMLVLPVIVILYFIFAVVSFFGLLLFKHWSRPMYVGGFLLSIPLYPAMGVQVISGVSVMLCDLSMAASGAILGMLYFSPVSEYYQKKAQKLKQ